MTFRRCPGRLLNILSTFNLSHVSTGFGVCQLTNYMDRFFLKNGDDFPVCTTQSLQAFVEKNENKLVIFLFRINLTFRDILTLLTGQLIRYRSSHPEMFLVKCVLKICSKFTGEHPCRSVISIKLQIKFIEITLRYGCSPVILMHIFRTPFTKSTSGGLLLQKIRKIRIPVKIYMADSIFVKITTP